MMLGSLDRTRLTELLDDLAGRLRRAGVRANVYIVGGAAMTLAYRRDRTTHDIDARIDSGHSATVNAVRDIARERGLPESWLNAEGPPVNGLVAAPGERRSVGVAGR